ncbi:MAG: F0F1 ATP synthase subunit beta, partial [Weissella cibaria]
MNTGRVVQVIGPVVDVAFPSGTQVPDINNALIIDKGEQGSLTVEVSLALG